jgi:hypothetical protein
MLVPKQLWYYDGCQLEAKKNISTYSNPNGTDISISTQHIDILGFSCTISQKKKKYSNQYIFHYSKKHNNLKERRKTMIIQWNKKRCVENVKISGEICEKNIQHDKNKKKNALLCG